MHVLIAVNSLGTGGAERSLTDLLPLYVERGVRPLIACLFRRIEGVQDAVTRAGFDVRFMEGNSLAQKTLSLRRLIHRERPDLVHTNLFKADLAGRFAAAGQVPVLTSLVNTSYSRERLLDPNVRALRLEATRLVDGFTARWLTSHFHAVTSAVKEASIQALGVSAERITVVERGRSTARLGEPSAARRMEVRRRERIPDDALVLTNVGREEFQKGQLCLLRAFDRLASLEPKAILLIAGRRGSASSQLDKEVGRMTHASRVRRLGHRSDVPDLLAASDVFVFPSLFEGMGGAAIEAMALGLPVVTTPTMSGVVAENDSALITPPEQPDALHDALARLAQDTSLKDRLAARGRQLFLERYQLDRAADRMVALYRHVVTTHARSPARSHAGQPGVRDQ